MLLGHFGQAVRNTQVKPKNVPMPELAANDLQLNFTTYPHIMDLLEKCSQVPRGCRLVLVTPMTPVLSLD